MALIFKKVSSEKFAQLERRCITHTGKVLKAALVMLDKEENLSGIQTTTAGLIMKVQDEKLPFLVQTKDGQFLRYNNAEKAKYFLKAYYKIMKKYQEEVVNHNKSVQANTAKI